LLIQPEAQKRHCSADKKFLLWMDNCGTHHVKSLQPLWDAANIQVQFLPKNMTFALQPLDLVVNGPLKAYVRKMRAQRIFAYFQSYRAALKTVIIFL
jgi:hypothetical protein